MSSFLCFLCHSTVSSETNEETRDKYREVVGMHLCPDSHLCHVCCHMLHKLCLFRAMCLKRSLEYPVLFSEKGTINLQRSDLDHILVCPEGSCKPTPYSINKSLYSNYNSKTYSFNYHNQNEFYETDHDCNTSSNQYVELKDDKVLENVANHSESGDRNYVTDYDENLNQKSVVFNEDNENDGDRDYVSDYDENLNQKSAIFNEDNTNNSQNQNKDNLYDQTTAVQTSVEERMYAMNDDNANSPIHLEYENEVEEYVLPTKENELQEVTNYETEYEEESAIKYIAEIEDTDVVPGNTPSKKAKTKKVKKKSYEKIVLSFKEQKSVLEAQRREKKYMEAQFKCYSCALGFLFKDTYQSHMVRHEESNGQFSCSVCGLRFATQNARCMHVILHSETYECNKCGAHVKRPHRSRHSRECWGANTDTASCHLCGKEFKDGNCLQQHLKRFHLAKTNKRMYSCNVCGKSYPDQGAVRTHMIKHINRRFACERCESTFTSPYSLNQHKKLHVEVESQSTDQWVCTLCDTWYKSKKNLMAHYKNTLKHQQTSFECPICSRNCPNARALSSHIESHSATKQHYCDICGSTHTTRKALTRHMGRHLPQSKTSKAVCHLCGASFKGASKLKRHLKEVCERARLEEELASYYEQGNELELHT